MQLNALILGSLLPGNQVYFRRKYLVENFYSPANSWIIFHENCKVTSQIWSRSDSVRRGRAYDSYIRKPDAETSI